MEDLNKIKDYIHGIIFKQKENKNENSANTGVEAGPGITAESAETAVADLRNRYSEKVRANFENTAKKLREERDAALRENWVLQQQAEAALPEQMAAAGINGGASETTLANIKAKYQGDRNDIRNGFANELGELSFEHSRQQAENENRYNEKWLEYLLSLAQMEEKYKHEKELG